MKSQWTLSVVEEFECFKNVDGLSSICSDAAAKAGWGLHIVSNKASYLGNAAANAPNAYRPLFIAKFVRSARGMEWHGYPANSEAHDKDVPPPEALNRWHESGYLTLRAVRKISQRKKCTLSN